MLTQLYLIRHGETAWSLTGRHTGRTDLPLTEKGERDARRLAERLRPVSFSEVLSSPRLRACQTCSLAGFANEYKTEADLAEWDYGKYEGMRTDEIRAKHPGWNVFKDGCPGGESPDEASERIDRLIQKLRTRKGRIALFSHGHIGRVIATRWIGEPVLQARHLLLDAASISVLSHEHDDPEAPVISLWNEVAGG